MKTKNSLRAKNRPVIREIKPKSQPKQAISIRNLSFSNDQNGTTFVKIYPSQVIITSNSLIEMIEAKKESIPVHNNICILRDDILYAIHNFPCDESAIGATDRENNANSTTQSDEPKRPTNAFILYRTALGRKIKMLFPSFSNSDISKFIGAMWKAASDEVKEKYINQALQCRVLHRQKYPNFEYNSKKASNVQKIIDTDISADLDNWDSYLDWCTQTMPNEVNSNNVRPLDDLALMNSQFSWDSFDPNSGLFSIGDLSNAEQQDYQDWNNVCRIVSEFFPEDSSRNIIIDEKLWTSLGNIDMMHDGEDGLGSLIDADTLRLAE